MDDSRGAAILEDAVEGTKVVARVEKVVINHVISAPDHTAKLQDLLQGLLHPTSLVMDYKAVTRL